MSFIFDIFGQKLTQAVIKFTIKTVWHNKDKLKEVFEDAALMASPDAFDPVVHELFESSYPHVAAKLKEANTKVHS